MKRTYWSEVIPALHVCLDDLLGEKSSITILEAGCGSISYVHLKQKCYTVGIDISEKQLNNNTVVDSKIVGDIQSYRFQPHSFDVIICWNVLEHLARPEVALSNFVDAVRENGLIVLALPNLLSLKGLVTKFSPHWFHSLFHTAMKFDRKDLADIAEDRFKTYFHLSITPNAIRRFAQSKKLDVKYFCIYDTSLKQRSRALQTAYNICSNMAKFISCGILGDSELLTVLQHAKSKTET